MATLIGAGAGPGWLDYVRARVGKQDQAEYGTWRDHYGLLHAYYKNNGLYDELRVALGEVGAGDLRSLRNPAYRVVEFYAAKLWPGSLPGALPIEADNEAIIEPIEQVWAWSNWGSEKQAVARSFPMYGDLFVKIATRQNGAGKIERVYMQSIEPADVTAMDTDERGYLTYFRVDKKSTRRRADGGLQTYYHTEIWDKAAQTFRYWERDTDQVTLGAPVGETPFSAWGIDFIPVVWQPFRHTGDERGMAAITPALDKIDEVNRQATRLHSVLYRYNKPLWAASANGVDGSGRPLPPPRLGDSNQIVINDIAGSDDIVKLPGMSTLTPLIPPIDYSSALAILTDQMADIRQDLPEMIYSQIQEKSGLSGVAIMYLMEAAIDRLKEARGNAETALKRSHEIALTIGSRAGLFKGIGLYEDGAFDHTFTPRPVLSTPELERAQLVQTYVSATVPLITAVRRAGWTETEIDKMIEDQAEEARRAQSSLGVALLNAQDNFDSEDVDETNDTVTGQADVQPATVADE